MEPFDDFVRLAREAVEERLDTCLKGPEAAPPRIVEALRYAVLGGGKRVRPLLLLASAEASSPAPLPRDADTWQAALTAACAIELIHTFSLIHDDLPALDNDALRRGRPTLHVKFDEATAVLAGDALLNLAYETLAAAPGGPDPRCLGAIATISRAVGLRGMIAGQVLDLENEGRAPEAASLERIHALKTGALITAACEVGGVVAGAGERACATLRAYGREVGLAFQIIDDVLDVEGTASALGKSPGKDANDRKATYPALWGCEESRRRAAACVARAREACAEFGARGDHLASLAEACLARTR